MVAQVFNLCRRDKNGKQCQNNDNIAKNSDWIDNHCIHQPGKLRGRVLYTEVRSTEIFPWGRTCVSALRGHTQVPSYKTIAF
jgi:hypothetical protein